MTKKYTNNTNVSLSMAVWLANDTYDHNADKKVISVTTIIKGIKQIILSSRVPLEDTEEDVANVIASRMGTAIHDSIESAWINNYSASMTALGYPQRVIDRIVINPTKDPEDLALDAIPVYLEKRSEKIINGVTVSGKFDIVAEQRLEDFKSTGVFTYINKTKDEDYSWQGSLYRWLNPKIIIQDTMAIQFIFTDWKAMMAAQDPKYPKNKVMEYIVPLKSLAETETYLKDKINQLNLWWLSPEEDLPECGDKELWRKAPKFKYYKNPTKMARSTKNFDTLSEANIRAAKDGGVGIVVENKDEVVGCKYCAGAGICKQKDTYILDGTLKM